jgi:hypothetical protein
LPAPDEQTTQRADEAHKRRENNMNVNATIDPSYEARDLRIPRNLDQLKRRFKEDGSHYFDEDNVKFFKSKPLAFYPLPSPRATVDGLTIGYLVETKQSSDNPLKRIARVCAICLDRTLEAARVVSLEEGDEITLYRRHKVTIGSHEDLSTQAQAHKRACLRVGGDGFDW